MSLLSMQDVVIDGKAYQIRPLNVVEGRKVYAKLQRTLAILGDEKLGALDPILVATLSGTLTESDLEFLVTAFAPTTTAVTGTDEKGEPLVQCLKDKGVQDALFAGNFEAMFEWLAACIQVNFAGLIAKMRSAVSSFGDKAQDSQPKA